MVFKHLFPQPQKFGHPKKENKDLGRAGVTSM
jgi:hypothetical protein